MRTWLACAMIVALLVACGGQAGPKPSGSEGSAPKGSAPQGGEAKSAAPAEPAAAKKPVRVAFVTNNASDFWLIAEAGTKKAAKELGCDVDFRIPSTGTAQEQQQILEDLVVTGVSGIAISPNDPANWTEVLNNFASKVNLVTQDSDAPNSNRACYIGSSNIDAGKAAGELLKEALPDGGKIMLFVGKLDAQNAQDRIKGIREVLTGTAIEILDTLTDEADRAKAVKNVEDTLVRHPDVACLVGLWSYNGPAILNGVRSSGKLGQVKIVCFDEEDETLQGVKDGSIFATVVQQPFEFGYQSVKTLVALANGDRSVIPPEKQIIVPVLKIKQADVDAFWSRLKELRGK